MKQEAASQKRGDGKLPGGIQDEDSDELILENILVDIVGQTLANKMPQSDPEYKQFKENYDRVVAYFQERLDSLSLDLVYEVFQEANNRQEEIVNVLSRNMLDICDLVRFFAIALRHVNAKATVETSMGGDDDSQKKEVSVFSLVVETLAQIGNKILNTDPVQTEVFFLEYGLDELLDVVADNAFKRNEATVLLYCFVQQTTNAHLRVLRRTKEKLSGQKRDAYYAVLAKLLLYEDGDDFAPELYDFYLREAAQGIYLVSPVTRTKCVSVLSYLSRIHLQPILPLVPYLQKMTREDHWELKGQLIILCSNALLFFNTQPLAEEVSEEDKILEASNEQSRVQQSDSKARRQQVIAEQEVESFTPLLFEIINAILTTTAPKATIKVGLLYLAKILHFYPEFTDTYLHILLSAPDKIRSATLEVDPLPGTEEEVYVSGANTEKYRTYGAPHEWNALFVAQALEKFVVGSNLMNLEWAHIEIFEACLQQEFKEEELRQWLAIFASLKNYFFIALCYRDFSVTAIEILKKFFCHEAMQPSIVRECLEIFIKTLQLVYQPDTDPDCKQNAREFLEFLHDCDEGQSALKEFVYNAVKNFAEQNQKAYQASNLVELMNKVVEFRRGDIFEDGLASLRSSQHLASHGGPANTTGESTGHTPSGGTRGRQRFN